MFEGSIDSIDISVILDEEFSPEARSAALADFAREVLAEAEKQDVAALGSVPTHSTTVDGYFGGDESRVRPDGTIEYAFNVKSDIFAWIADMLLQFAPVLSGAFKASFELYADSVVIDPAGEIPQASEFVFLSTEPYAGEIEGETGPPESRQAPNGVFEAVAALAQGRFVTQANISFSYRRPFDGSSLHFTPAITIALRS